MLTCFQFLKSTKLFLFLSLSLLLINLNIQLIVHLSLGTRENFIANVQSASFQLNFTVNLCTKLVLTDEIVTKFLNTN